MKIEIIKGDITQMQVDAVVNAAKNSLLGGGGVDGAIHCAGGNAILQECIKINKSQGGCPTGDAVITTAGNMPAKYVIHTVGPVWHGGNRNEAMKLKSCYANSLSLAVKHNIRTIAFPNISTGVYGYPKSNAAKIALETVERIKPGLIDCVYFVCFDSENYAIYKELVQGK